ncbi:hypothetical protein FHS61_001452 [Altererythrobacter atlanticus]|uniref:Uncharacterized protein n=1 Tax=Croceibacterium atlanticum TaxID=1267766 RepID=A0A0F7KUU1_9SPHN|nr:transporter [Croceibacterium atlanticum]AKH44133.1 hypothetical protein WYH_03114 [Croceibacterium atlanticum]MBB5732443.1 hypothetical protein [Croceibacterium atlanticum]
MHRYLLATTAVLAISAPAAAKTVSDARTQPLRTSTINNGAPDAIVIDEDGSVVLTAGTAVTMDSNHAVTNDGKISVGNANGGRGIAALAGTSGDIVNTGTITLDESYEPEDEDNDGDLDGPFAIGSNRVGISTQGAHTGNIRNDGTIAVQGNDSAGIRLEGPLTGKLVHDGTTGVVGDRSVGVEAGDIAGDVRLAGSVSARGEDAIGARFAGDVDGALVVQGTVSATGYRKTTAPGNTSKLDDDDLLQGGSALSIEGDVTGGIVLATAPADTDPADDDEDSDGIPDKTEGNAAVVSYGAAPAMSIGSANRDISIGSVAGTASGYGLVVEGVIAGRGVYSGVDATGLSIGGLGGAVSFANGIGIAGTVSAEARGADATAIYVGSGADVPELRVSGTVSAKGSGNSATTSTAILIGQGADLPLLRVSGKVEAVASGDDGTAHAIRDTSGTLALIENSGAISATGAEEGSGRNIAIDLAANTQGATIRQTQVASGVAAPAITGDIRFGSGSDVLDVADGKVSGAVFFGAGNNQHKLSGDAVQTGSVAFGAGNDAMSLAGSSVFTGSADFGGGADTLSLSGSSRFSGSLAGASGLTVNVSGGTLDVSTPASISSLSVGASGHLAVTLDKDAGEGTYYDVAGTASFAEGATLSLRLASVADAEGNYVILDAGTLEGLDGIETDTDMIPFMFKASLSEDAPANQLSVDVARRTTAELGLNRSQAGAYDAIYAALANDEDVEGVFLGITNGDQFRQAVRQMVPDHAGGSFQGVSLGARTFARQVSEPQSPVYTLGGLDVIVGTGAWGMNKSEGQTAAYDLGGFGFTAAGEVDTGFGSLGAQVSWLWNEHTNGSASHRVQSDTYELAGYWRGKWGGFAAFARGSIGTVDFHGRRTLKGAADGEAVELSALSEWSGTLVTFNGGASFEGGGKHFFFRPAVTVDYARLDEDGYTDTGGGEALDLMVDSRKSDEFAVNGGLTLGVDFTGTGRRDRNWFRIEGEGGWREIVDGSLGATTARFEDGEDFTLDADELESGWYARLRALGGSESYQLSGELGAEDRMGETAYSLRGSLRMAF